MTASGLCYECKKVATSFHYITPYDGKSGNHNGYWHCPEHGPSSAFGKKQIEEKRKEEPTFGMNRKQRREHARSKR